MKKELAPEERLIVAADFKPYPEESNPWLWVDRKIHELSRILKGTGVYL